MLSKKAPFQVPNFAFHSNTSMPRNQAPMLSHYLTGPATVVERTSNHLPLLPIEETKKTVSQYLRSFDPVIGCSGTNDRKRGQEVVIGDDAYILDLLLAELDNLAQLSHTRAGSRSSA